MSAEIFKKLLGSIDSLTGVQIRNIMNKDTDVFKAYKYIREGYENLSTDQKTVFSNAIKDEVNAGSFYGKTPQEDPQINDMFSHGESLLSNGNVYGIDAIVKVGKDGIHTDVTGRFKSLLKAYGAATEPQPQNIPFLNPIEVPQSIASFEPPRTSSSEPSFSDAFSNIKADEPNAKLTHEEVNTLIDDANKNPATTLENNIDSSPKKLDELLKDATPELNTLPVTTLKNSDQSPINPTSQEIDDLLKDVNIDSLKDDISNVPSADESVLNSTVFKNDADELTFNDNPSNPTPVNKTPGSSFKLPETLPKETSKPSPTAIPVQQTKEEIEKAAQEKLVQSRREALEKRRETNPVFAALDKIDNIEKGTQDSVAYQAFNQAFQQSGAGGNAGVRRKQVDMLREELLGANRNSNPETVNQRIDFYKNQGHIDDVEAEPLKAFFNTNFENMDEEGVQGFFKQYNENLKNNMTPKQARLSVNQQMDNKTEGFFSTNSDDNFKKFAGRSLMGGAFGAAIGTATDDNPEAGFVAGMVGASVGRNAARLLRNNTDMFEGKMINSLLKDNAKGKTRPQQLEAVQDLDDESLDFMDKMYKDKLTNNFGTKNMFENSAVTGSRAMTLSGAALAGVAFTPKKRDHRRGFNANRGNRI